MHKKRVLTLALISLVFLSVISLVVAAPSTSELVQQVQNFFEPILKAIFGEGSQGLVFEELLFALLIVAFVYMALDRVPVIRNNPFALWTATIASAILAVRFIVTENLVTLLLFVEFGLSGAGSRVMRKIAWVVLAVVFAFLWYKQQEYGVIFSDYANIYLIAAGASILLLLLDGTIQRAIRKSRGKTAADKRKDILIDRVDQEINKLLEQMVGTRGKAASESIKSRIEQLEKRKETIRKAGR